MWQSDDPFPLRRWVASSATELNAGPAEAPQVLEEQPHGERRRKSAPVLCSAQPITHWGPQRVPTQPVSRSDRNTYPDGNSGIRRTLPDLTLRTN